MRSREALRHLRASRLLGEDARELLERPSRLADLRVQLRPRPPNLQVVRGDLLRLREAVQGLARFPERAAHGGALHPRLELAGREVRGDEAVLERVLRPPEFLVDAREGEVRVRGVASGEPHDVVQKRDRLAEARLAPGVQHVRLRELLVRLALVRALSRQARLLGAPAPERALGRGGTGALPRGAQEQRELRVLREHLLLVQRVHVQELGRAVPGGQVRGARVDAAPRHLRAEALLRSRALPRGEHLVRFRAARVLHPRQHLLDRVRLVEQSLLVLLVLRRGGPVK